VLSAIKLGEIKGHRWAKAMKNISILLSKE